MIKILRLHPERFPNKEITSYGLKMVGAKGSLNIEAVRDESGVNLKCQVLGSLIIPPKKLVDNQIISRLELADGTDGDEMRLVRHQDQDYKSESRRIFELKKHGIETRFIKFEEERGYLDYPQEAVISEIADPLSVLFLVRDPELLINGRDVLSRLLTRTSIIEVLWKKVDERTTEVKPLQGERSQIRIQPHQRSAGVLKGPYLSEDLEIWLDQKTGLVTEITYPFLGTFGKATLVLEKFHQDL